MLNKEKENLVIVDINAVVHSSFHGYPEQPDAKNEDQRILYGIMNNLISLNYNLPKIDYLYVVFDPEDGSLYRKSLFPSYKANRPPTDPELHRQRNVAKKVLEDHLGVATLTHPGYEADDIIGTLANLASKDYNVIIVSPDKDLAQLVNKDVLLLRKIRSKSYNGYQAYDEAKVYEHFGVYPYQIPDWLALVGDTADNLPGVDKIGDKTAATLLKTYPSIEHMFAIMNEIKDSKIKEKIINSKETLFLVKKLATIVCDLKIEEDAYNCMEKANRIRADKSYNQKLLTLKRHYNWPNHFIELFYK